MKLGFTFSFPVEQQALDKALLIQWTKGFDVDGVVGTDIVEQLQVWIYCPALDHMVAVKIITIYMQHTDKACDEFELFTGWLYLALCTT